MAETIRHDNPAAMREVSIDLDGVELSAFVGTSERPIAETIWGALHALYQKAGEPVSFNRAKWAKDLGVCQKTISNAVSRLKAEHRLEQRRRGREYLYRTITGPQQVGLVSVNAIAARPGPITSVDQLQGTWMAPSSKPTPAQPGNEQVAGNCREPGGNVTGTLGESGEQVAGNCREPGGNVTGTLGESGEQVAGNCREPGGNVTGTLGESGEQVAGNCREPGGNVTGTLGESGEQVAGNQQEAAAQIPLVSCPRCGPGSMVPTKIRALQTASLPGTTYYCAGSNRSCSLLWHSTEGVIYEAGQRQLTHEEATIFVQRHLGKPESALPTDGTNQQRGRYLDAYRRRFGQLPWDTEEGQRVIAGVTERNTDGDDPEPRGRVRACAPAGRPGLNINQVKPEILTGPAGAHTHTREDRPDSADRIAERPP